MQRCIKSQNQDLDKLWRYLVNVEASKEEAHVKNVSIHPRTMKCLLLDNR